MVNKEYNRLQKLTKNNSLFVFGARGTGKSSLLRKLYKKNKTTTLWIDLLSDADEERYSRNPDELSLVLNQKKYTQVIIDEIQKVPKLLDIVHREMEKKKEIKFILTGSSARKLKRGSANLLAGRAFTYYLFPFTFFELDLEKKFDLLTTLEIGTLPKIFSFSSKEDKFEFLRGYIRTYLKEEIQLEQIVRDLDPFRDFLEIAAQMNGKPLNFSKIASDVGVDDKTIKSYYQILEDTLVGYFLPSFHRSIRKRQKEAPKFYFFDTGVKRALDRTIRVSLAPETVPYGDAFEHFLILECMRLNEYFKLDYRFSYLRTKDDAEIDLIIERPGEKDLLIEFKSTKKVKANDYRNLLHLSQAWDRPCEAQIWSNDHLEKKDQTVECLFWQNGLKKLFR